MKAQAEFQDWFQQQAGVLSIPWSRSSQELIGVEDMNANSPLDSSQKRRQSFEGFAHLSEAMDRLLHKLTEEGERLRSQAFKSRAEDHSSTEAHKDIAFEQKKLSGVNWPKRVRLHSQDEKGKSVKKGRQSEFKGQAPHQEDAKTAEVAVFGFRIPTAPRRAWKRGIARIAGNPLVWASKEQKAESKPEIPQASRQQSTNSTAGQFLNPLVWPSKEQKAESKPEIPPASRQQSTDSTAGQFLGQTVDSVKSAVAGLSSNVMDNLPPLRKTAYPDRKKLSSVQEFYRYTEAEGRRLFEELDSDADGQVTLEDLEAAMRRRKLPQEYARKFLRKVRRGLFAKSFTWQEFSALMDEREPAILRAYNSLDLNSAGTLQRSQIKASLQRNGLPTTDRNINAMMRFLTGEADGQIAYGQFRNFLLLLPPERLRDHPSTVWFEAATVVPLYAPAVATESVLKSALAGGLACAIPTFFLHPVDTMKTRVQASTMSLKDLVKQLPEIGARGLYRGAVPAIAGQFAGQGLRTGMLEASKAVLKNVAPDLPEMQVQSLASFTSTFLGTALRIPCEVMKQRCQAGMYPNWQQAMLGTYRSDGLPGFFRGTTATLLREVPFYVAGMMIYEQIKKGVKQGIQRELKPWETIAVGGLSGGLAAVTTTPFDVLKTRMMTSQPGLANSMGATFMHILQHEGVMALYKGALPRFFWIAPLGAMNFAGYELAKRAMEDQDRRKMREAEAAAEEELRALEEAEEVRKRALLVRLPKLPNFREKLPQIKADLRKRLPKLPSSGDSQVSNRVKDFVKKMQKPREEKVVALAATQSVSQLVGSSMEKDIGRNHQGESDRERQTEEQSTSEVGKKSAVKDQSVLLKQRPGEPNLESSPMSRETETSDVKVERQAEEKRGFFPAVPVPSIFQRRKKESDQTPSGPAQASEQVAPKNDAKVASTEEEETESSTSREESDEVLPSHSPSRRAVSIPDKKQRVQSDEVDSKGSSNLKGDSSLAVDK